MVAVFVVVFLAAGFLPAPEPARAAPAPAKPVADNVIRELSRQQKKLVGTLERHEETLKDVELSLTYMKGIEAKVRILEEELQEVREELSARPGDQQQVGEAGTLQLLPDETKQEAGCEERYQSLGCWKDTNKRAIPTLEGKDPRLDGHYSTRADALDKCYAVARSLGMEVFALQNGGWCAGSSDEKVDFRKYGPSTRCYSNGEGGPWSSHVYEMKGSFVFFSTA
ncbi:Hypp7822 [Branchiostoma lanceolatum]|uniref:Hypp7822 protein n=1 Tax=Branchiostoma lanceolatum TaxID=7740 RepID=A0A8K0EG13_BRALA|nr:Hypp7822 [Branchiostoma lanceolatum]